MQRSDTNFARAQTEHKQLLHTLKSTVETLFLNSNSDTTDDTTASNELLLRRLHTSIKNIFIHGFRLFKQDNSPDIWRFIEGLNWINPLMTISIANQHCAVAKSPAIHIPYAHIRNDKALYWLYENLQQRKLSQKLKYLVSDAEHLSASYEITAFLQHADYQAALFMCLKAYETNQPNLLSQIDVRLYTERTLPVVHHKRSTSHPEFSFLPSSSRTTIQTGDPMGNKMSVPFSYDSPSCRSSHADITVPDIKRLSIGKRKKSLTQRKTQRSPQKAVAIMTNLKLRPWKSLPDLAIASTAQTHRMRSRTISQPIRIPFQLKSREVVKQATEQKVPSFTYKQMPSDSASSNSLSPFGSNVPPTIRRRLTDDDLLLQTISLVKCDDIKIHFDAKHRPPNDVLAQQLPISATTLPSSPPPSPLHESVSSAKSISPAKRFSFISRDSFSLFHIGGDKSFDSSCSPAGGAPTPATSDIVRTFLSPRQGEKIKNRMGPSILQFSPYAQQPQPLHDQSLTAFLQTAQFSRVNTELERENAHFSVSEAMISAIEQIRWTNGEKQRVSAEQRRTGVKKKMFRSRVQVAKATTWDSTGGGGSRSAAASLFVGAASSVSSSSSDYSCWVETDADSDDDAAAKDVEAKSTVPNNDDRTENVMAEWGDNNMDALSAESVALSLIAKFSDKQLPKASDLLWLVSEQDAPQKMLPMPGSWTVSPDEIYKIPFTRGTRDWAPPRPQIIFTRHILIERKKQLNNQNQRCAGCGMRVAAAYSHRFRYCDYLGKYFCTGCHRNHMSVIPARVLDRWDFTNRPVSVFSYRLLEEIWQLALFRVSDLNKTLYVNVRPLYYAKIIRKQLKFIQDFIVSCRFAESAKSLFSALPSHIADDEDIWSMADFLAVKSGTFVKEIDALIHKCENHVFDCELCTARGFICELCPRKQVIFPWQPKIRRCSSCGMCVHERCWKGNCAKCKRLVERNLHLLRNLCR